MIDSLKILNFLPAFILGLLLQISFCLGPEYTPKGMDYELRRPITYLYNRLAYKFDFNPYTSHLLDTQTQCSSRTGPFCGFINNRELMDRKMPISPADEQIYALLVSSVASNRDVAFQIERKQLDAFLISGDYTKKMDESVKRYIEPDFYQKIASHDKMSRRNSYSNSKKQMNRNQQFIRANNNEL